MAAFFGGANIFGIAVSVRHQPNLTAAQMNAFFGLTGSQSLFGGGRGRGFLITGVLRAGNPASCVAAENTLLSYADGIARVLTDPLGVTWANVCFYGDYQRTNNPQYVPITNNSWGLPYRAVLVGLT